jgi:tripartite-type tricarboxylate transporter receptor subunit TctC
MTRRPLTRRDTMRLVASLGFGAWFSSVAHADSPWPSHPVRMVIPYPPGGAGDLVGRLFAQPLSQQLGQSIVVDNRAGGGQIIGTTLAANAAPDGYTLLLATTTHAINPGLHTKLPYDSLAGFTPITSVGSSALLLVVNPSFGVSSIKDLVAKAKAAPGTINFGSAGIGSGGHLAVELLKEVAGIDLTHVPYPGAGPALTDLQGGRVQLLCTSPLAAMPFVKAGRLRALAVTSAARSSLWPEIPTVAETGYPDYRATLWYALLGPARLNGALVARIHDAASSVLNNPKVRDQFGAQGLETAPSMPEELEAFLRDEIQRYSRVIERAHIPRT